MKRTILTIALLFATEGCQDASLEEDNEFLQCMVDQLSGLCYYDGGDGFCNGLRVACTDACGELSGDCADACFATRDACLDRCTAPANAIQLYCVEGMPYRPLD